MKTINLNSLAVFSGSHVRNHETGEAEKKNVIC